MKQHQPYRTVSTLINELFPPHDDPVTGNLLSTKISLAPTNPLLPRPY